MNETLGSGELREVSPTSTVSVKFVARGWGQYHVLVNQSAELQAVDLALSLSRAQWFTYA